MAIEVYLNFNGNCREAVEFYADVFKTEKPVFMTYGESPPDPDWEMPEGAKDLIMHTNINIGGSRVMFSDAFPWMPLVMGNNISLTFLSKDIEEIKSIFNQMKVGGNVGMELQETFWSKSYGTLTDKFGVEWQFSHDNEGKK